SLPIVPPGLHLLAPVAVIEVPADSIAQSGFECVARGPSQLLPDLRGVDRIAPIVARTIGNEGFQRATTLSRWTQLVDGVANPVHDLEVGPFVAAADIILFADAPVREHEQHAGAVILDVE